MSPLRLNVSVFNKLNPLRVDFFEKFFQIVDRIEKL